MFTYMHIAFPTYLVCDSAWENSAYVHTNFDF